MRHVHLTQEIRMHLNLVSAGAKMRDLRGSPKDKVKSSYPISSETPSIPMPALFTTKSTCPHTFIASRALALMVLKSDVTSRSIIWHVVGCDSSKSWILLTTREVAITLSPAASATSTMDRPRPLEVPTWQYKVRKIARAGQYHNYHGPVTNHTRFSDCRPVDMVVVNIESREIANVDNHFRIERSLIRVVDKWRHVNEGV